MHPIYLDVRTPEEFAEGHYPNAINHDVSLLMVNNFPDLGLVPKDAEIKVYCKSGGRARIATEALQDAGYIRVENIGGYQPGQVV